MSAGYDNITKWLEKDIVKYGGAIKLSQEVTAVELVEDDEDEGRSIPNTPVAVDTHAFDPFRLRSDKR